MKKKLLIFVSLLILLIIPLNAKADTYSRYCPSISELSFVDVNWGDKIYYVSSSAGQLTPLSSFCFHFVNGEPGLCGGIGKSTVNASSVTKYLISGNSNSNNDLVNNSGVKITGTQLENLKDLLSNGYQFDSINSLKYDNEAQKQYIAMQVLVWEVIEGGRTNFDYKTNGYAPQYNGSGSNKSAYQTIIEPNSQLLSYYKKIIQFVYEAQNPSTATAFNTDTYPLVWNKESKVYTRSISGLGKYTNCTSNNSNVIVTVDSTTATVKTSKVKTSATITCSYAVGNGSQSSPFIYYAFPSNLCTATNGCQNILYGKSIKIYSKSFKVATESTKLKIEKVDSDGNKLSGAVFTLTDVNDSSYSLTITGNSSSVTSIDRTTSYAVSETTVPSGYTGISDFRIAINAKTGKISNCTKPTTDSSGAVLTCGNGRVTVSYSNDTIILKITNTAKNFKLIKVDDSNNSIIGAGFTIKDSKGNDVKFKLVNNIYNYDTSGTITEIKNSNTNAYSIALLPAGEYSIVETTAPYPYLLADKEADRTTKIKIDSSGSLLVYDSSQKTYVSSSSVIVKNYKSQVIINKIGDGKPLEGVKFLLYDGTKSVLIKSTLSNGVYTFLENQADADNNNYVTNQDGNIIINNLPVGNYYLREVETISPYTLPEGEAAYTEIKVAVNQSGVLINGSSKSKTINISNSPYTFNFYKVNEEGAYLSGGKYKIQKYDSEKNRFVDLRIKEVKNDGTTYLSTANIFEPNEDGNTKFTLTNGIATFINMEASSRYRIVELEAPTDYEISDTNDTVEVTIDQFGNASGMLTLVNEKVVTEEGGSSAELIVNIATGMDRVSYSLIIGGTIILIGCLFLIIKKIDKKNKKK